MKQYISARRLFDGSDWREDCVVVLDGERIEALLPRQEVPADSLLQLPGTLAPGFIDLQVNGGGGVMLNSQPDREGVERIAGGHRATGTTAMMPTVVSDRPQVQAAAVNAVREAIAAGNRAVLGVHIEGPFFEPAKRGTHHPDMIRAPGDADIDWLCRQADLPLILTLAPEHVEPGQLRRLSEAGVLLCAGHTDADYEQICQAVANGLRGFTHLYNAMSQLGSREPGTVGAALDHDELWVGIIADGHHVHPASLRIACAAKPRDKVFLVTDAMATVGGEQPWFEIYGERIEVRDGRLVNSEGALAGAHIGMIDAVRIATEDMGLALEHSLAMAGANPAAFLGLERELGHIGPGYRADLVHFDRHYAVRDTWIAGQHQQHPN